MSTDTLSLHDDTSRTRPTVERSAELIAKMNFRNRFTSLAREFDYTATPKYLKSKDKEIVMRLFDLTRPAYEFLITLADSEIKANCS